MYRIRSGLSLTYTSDFRLFAASCKQSVRYSSTLLLKAELLKMSLRQFNAWTCGSLDPSVSDMCAGRSEISRSWCMTVSKDGRSALEERIPTINDGMPADLRVVEACV